MSSHLDSVPHTSALRVALIYAVFAALWILLSDRTLGLVIRDPDLIVQASMVKGWFFVAVTTLLFYVLVRGLVTRQQEAHRREIDVFYEQQRTLDLLAAIADNSEDVIFAKDLKGRYLLFNDAASRFVGKPVAEVLDRDDRAIFPAEQAAQLMEASQRVITSGHTETNEEILDTAQGRRVFLTTRGPLRDAGKRIFGIFGISRDITEQKRLDGILRESEARFRALFESMSSGVAVYRAIDDGADFVFTDFNHAGEQIEKTARSAVIGRRLSEVFPGVVEFGLPDVLRRVWRSGQTEHFPIGQYRDQRIVGWRENFVCRLPSGEVAAIYDDITERKIAEAALKESETRFHDIVEVSADWIWEVDAEGRLTYASDSVFDLLGYTPAEIIGKAVFDLMPPEEAARVRTEFLAIAARKEVFRDFDNLNRHKDGSLRHVWTNGKPILSADGFLLGYRGLDRDITEKKLAEAELLNTKDLLRAVINTIPDLVWLKDLQGRYLSCNPRFEAFFGAGEEAIIGKTDYDFVPRELADFFRTNDQAAINACGPTVNVEEVTFASDGHREILQTIKTPLHDETGQVVGVLGIGRDISNIKAVEDELCVRNEELERFNRASVGRELDMIALKQEVNALACALGREPPYALDFLDVPPDSQAGPRSP